MWALGFPPGQEKKIKGGGWQRLTAALCSASTLFYLLCLSLEVKIQVAGFGKQWLRLGKQWLSGGNVRLQGSWRLLLGSLGGVGVQRAVECK